MSTREEIIAVAAELFHRHGYAHVSLAQIATAAGIQKGNLSYHFKSKDSLLPAVAAYWRQVYVDPIIAQEDWVSPAQAVERFLQAVQQAAPMLAQHGCPVGGLLGDAQRSAPAQRPCAAANLASLQNWLRLQLERRLPAEQARAGAEHILVRMQGAAVMAQLAGDPGVVVRQMDAIRDWLAGVAGWHDAS